MVVRMIVRSVVVVALLYALLAMAAALARVPAPATINEAGQVQATPAIRDSELHELRTEDVVP